MLTLIGFLAILQRVTRSLAETKNRMRKMYYFNLFGDNLKKTLK